MQRRDSRLLLVAGIRSGQVQKLEEAGVTTLNQLAKLREQAAMQLLGDLTPIE